MATITDQSTVFLFTQPVGYSALNAGSQGLQNADETAIFLLTQLVAYSGLNAGSQGSQDFTDIFIDETGFVPMAQVGDFDSTSKLTTGFNTYFKVQGYNPLTGTYEVWHCRGTPLLLPPSGHHLLNVAVVASWIDR